MDKYMVALSNNWAFRSGIRLDVQIFKLGSRFAKPQSVSDIFAKAGLNPA